MTKQTYTYTDLLNAYLSANAAHQCYDEKVYYQHFYSCLSNTFQINLNEFSPNPMLNVVFARLCTELLTLQSPVSTFLDATAFHVMHRKSLRRVIDHTNNVCNLYFDTLLALFRTVYPHDQTCTHEDLIRCGYDAGKEPDYDKIWDNV